MIAFNWYEILYNIFMATVLIPISLGLISWRLLTRAERWLVIFLTALLAHELLAILLIALHTRNHFLYYIQTVAVLCSVAGVYDSTIGPRYFLWRIAIGVSMLMVLEVGLGVGFNHINSITLSLSRLLPALYALISLHRLFTANATRSLTLSSQTYIHLGFFVFGAFSVVTMYFKSYFIETSLNLYYFFDNMSGMMSAVAFGFFSVGFFRILSSHRLQMQ